MVVNTLFPPNQSALNVKILDTWNKNSQHVSSQLGKEKALATALNDTEPEIESNDSDDEGILSSFTTTVDPIEGIVEVVDEKEDLVESKFEKMDD